MTMKQALRSGGSAQPRQRRRAAYHEAAHAVARIHVGAVSTDVEIRTDGSGLSHGTGEVWRSASSTGTQYEVWDWLLMTLAGGFAEARVAKRSVLSVTLSGAWDDWDTAQRSIDWLVDQGFAVDDARAWRRAEEYARDFVREHWPAIERVAQALLERGRLDAAEVKGIAG